LLVKFLSFNCQVCRSHKLSLETAYQLQWDRSHVSFSRKNFGSITIQSWTPTNSIPLPVRQNLTKLNCFRSILLRQSKVRKTLSLLLLPSQHQQLVGRYLVLLTLFLALKDLRLCLRQLLIKATHLPQHAPHQSLHLRPQIVALLPHQFQFQRLQWHLQQQ
jgi:hypothetical protein